MASSSIIRMAPVLLRHISPSAGIAFDQKTYDVSMAMNQRTDPPFTIGRVTASGGRDIVFSAIEKDGISLDQQGDIKCSGTPDGVTNVTLDIFVRRGRSIDKLAVFYAKYCENIAWERLC